MQILAKYRRSEVLENVFECLLMNTNKQTQLTIWHTNCPTEARSYYTVQLDISRRYVTPIATCPHLPLHSTHSTRITPYLPHILFPRGFLTTALQGFIVSIRRRSVPSASFVFQFAIQKVKDQDI